MSAAMVILLLLSAHALAADDAKEHSWSSLQQLSSGQRVVIVQKDMKSHQGSFLSVSNESILIHESGGEVTVQRSDVLRVNARGKPKRFRNALIGGLLGSVAGSTANSADRELWVPVGFWVGVAAGALLPLHSERTIYRAGD